MSGEKVNTNILQGKWHTILHGLHKRPISQSLAGLTYEWNAAPPTSCDTGCGTLSLFCCEETGVAVELKTLYDNKTMP